MQFFRRPALGSAEVSPAPSFRTAASKRVRVLPPAQRHPARKNGPQCPNAAGCLMTASRFAAFLPTVSAVPSHSVLRGSANKIVVLRAFRANGRGPATVKPPTAPPARRAAGGINRVASWCLRIGAAGRISGTNGGAGLMLPAHPRACIARRFGPAGLRVRGHNAKTPSQNSLGRP